VAFVTETTNTKLVVYSQTDPSRPADATNDPTDERLAATATVVSDPLAGGGVREPRTVLGLSFYITCTSLGVIGYIITHL
jgi:hypothetical protein